MKTSPLQLKQCLFRKVHIKARSTDFEPKYSAFEPFDFNGVGVDVTTEVSVAEGEYDDPRHFAFRLQLKVTNERGKPAPYDIDVDAVGFLEISEKISKDERADFVAVNGAALVYGAIRETVSSITSRSIPGPAILPAVTFIDQKGTLRIPTSAQVTATPDTSPQHKAAAHVKQQG